MYISVDEKSEQQQHFYVFTIRNRGDFWGPYKSAMAPRARLDLLAIVANLFISSTSRWNKKTSVGRKKSCPYVSMVKEKKMLLLPRFSCVTIINLPPHSHLYSLMSIAGVCQFYITNYNSRIARKVLLHGRARRGEMSN